MPLTYADIRRQQQTANPWLQSLSPEDYSRVMGQITGAPAEYASGVDPGLLSQADWYLNRLIESTGAPEAAGQLGEAAFGETGRQVFHGVPRAIVNMAPMFIPGPGWVAGAARLGGAGLLSAAETYGATEKPGAAALTGLLAAATPKIMDVAGKATIQAMKGPADAAQAATLRAMMAEAPAEALPRLAQNVAGLTTAPTTTGQVLAGIGAGQAALTGAQTGVEAINILSDEDRSLRELISPEYWAAQALAQGVFGGLDVARLPGQIRQANRVRGMMPSTTLGTSSPLQAGIGLERPVKPEMRLGFPTESPEVAQYVQNLVGVPPEAAGAPAGNVVADLASQWPELTPREQREALSGEFGKSLRKKFDALPEERRNAIDRWFAENEQRTLAYQDTEWFGHATGELTRAAVDGDTQTFGRALTQRLREIQGRVPAERGPASIQLIQEAGNIAQRHGIDTTKVEQTVRGELKSIYGADAPEMATAMLSGLSGKAQGPMVTPELPGLDVPVAAEAGRAPDHDPEGVGQKELIRRRVAQGATREQAMKEISDTLNAVRKWQDDLPEGAVIRAKDGQVYTKDFDGQFRSADGSVLSGAATGATLMPAGTVRARPRPTMPREDVAAKARDPDPVNKAQAVATLPEDVQRALQMALDADIENGSTPEEATLAAVNRGAAMIADQARPASLEPGALEADMATFAQRLDLAKTDEAVDAETKFVLAESKRFGEKIGSGSAPDPTYTAYREWLEAGQPEGFDMFKARLRTKVNEQGKGERGRVTFTEFVGDDVSLAKHSEEATRAEAPEPELSTGTVPGEGPGTGTGDAEYMKAVESGDVATQQRLVDEAAQRAGYDTNKGQGYFHGSPDFEGNEFKREFMGRGSGVSRGAFNFTKNRAIAEAYEGQRYSDPDQVQIDDIVLRANRAFAETKMNEAQKAKLESDLGYQWETMEFDGRAIDDLPEFIGAVKDLAKWFDKNGFKETAKQLKEAAATPARKGQEPRLIRAYLKTPEEFTHPRGGDIIHQVRSSEQIKSADPIVRDDQGNVIPLSQRFNPEQKDIRYMRDPLAAKEEMAALVAEQKTNPNPETQARIEQLSVDRANATPDERIAHAGTFFGKLMRGMGMSEAEMAQRLPTVARLWTAVKELAGTDLAQLTTKGRQAYGLFAAGNHPLVMLSAEPRSSKLMGYTVAHELIGHGLWDAHARGQLEPKVSMQLDRTRKFVTGALPEDRALMLKWMTEGLPAELRKSPELAEILRTAETVQSPDEVMAHMNALAAMHMVEGRTSNLNGLVKYLPKPLSDFLVNAAAWASKSIRTLKMAFRGNKEMWDVLAGHEEAMKDVMRAGRETEVDALRLQAFAKMQEPGGMMDIMQDPAAASDWFSTVFDTSEFDGYGKDVAQWMVGPQMFKDMAREGKNAGMGAAGLGSTFANALKHIFRPLPQQGASKKAFRHAGELLSRRERMMTTAQNAFADIMSGRTIGPWLSFGKDSPVNQFYKKGDAGSLKAKDDILRWVTDSDRSKTAYEHVVAGTPEVMALFNKIAPEHQNNAKALLAQQDKLSRAAVKDRYDRAVALSASRTAANAIAGTDVRYEAAHGFFHAYGDKVKAGVPVDYAVMLQEAVPVLSTPGEDPALGVARATRYVDSFKDQVELAAERTAYNMENIGYTTERRLGPHRITFTKNGQTDFLTADNPKDMKQLMETLRREGATNVQEAEAGLTAMPGERVSDVEKGLGALIERQRLKLQAKGMPEAEIADILGAVDVRPELMTLDAQKDISSTHIKAKRTPGREYLDMTKQQWDWEQANLRQDTMAIADAEMRGVKNDQALKDTPEAHSLAVAFNNYKTPDTPSMKRISKFGYFMTLAGSFSNMAMEVMQPVVAFPWKLVDEGAGVVQANRLVANSYKQIFKAMLSPKYLKSGGNMDLSKLSADHQKVIQEAIDNGRLNSQLLNEFGDEGPTTAIFREGAVTLGKLSPNAAEPIQDAAQAAGRLAIKVHNKATNLSTSVALLSGYDFLRSKGLDHTTAMKQVWPLLTEGLYTGGRESRAAGIYDVGSARPVSSMMMSLTGYSLNTLTQMATYIARSTRKGIPRAERMSSMKAAAGMIATQVLFAGMMGLPGVGAAVRIFEKATGFDLEKWLEQLSDAGEDPGTSAMVKTLSMRGISHVLGGPDVSQRMGVTSILGFNEFDGFNLENLFGPVGSYAKKSVEAVGSLARGDVGSALEAVAPVPLRKTLQLWNDDWKFQSPTNDEILVKDPSMGDKISYALGWQPVKLNRARQVWSMRKRANEAAVAKDARVMGELADEIVDEKDVGEALKFLDARELERGPDFDRRAEAMKIAERVEKRVFVRDPGKEGTRVTGAADEAILRAMGVSAPTEEAARAQLRDNVLGALGARGYEHKAMESYRQIDELRRRNPFLTVAQARAQLQSPRRTAPPALRALLPLE